MPTSLRETAHGCIEMRFRARNRTRMRGNTLTILVKKHQNRGQLKNASVGADAEAGVTSMRSSQPKPSPCPGRRHVGGRGCRRSRSHRVGATAAGRDSPDAWPKAVNSPISDATLAEGRRWRDRIRGIGPVHSRQVMQRDTRAPAVGGRPDQQRYQHNHQRQAQHGMRPHHSEIDPRRSSRQLAADRR